MFRPFQAPLPGVSGLQSTPPAKRPEVEQTGRPCGTIPPLEERAIREDLEALRIDHREPPPRRPWRGLWVLLAILLLGAVAVSLWLRPWAEGTPVVRVARAVEGGAAGPATVLNASGYVTARRRATIASKITGRLVEVAVEEGMPVRREQVLARLDSTRERAALSLARSSLDAARRGAVETASRLELARATFARADRLLAERVIGQAEYDLATTEVSALEARLALQREQVTVAEREVELSRVGVEETVIRAPFDGMVVSKDAQEGEMVSPVSAGGGFTRTGICTIVDMQSLEIEVDVNEAYISRVRNDQPVEAVIDAYPDWRIPAHVITTIPTADRQKATVQVRIAFDEIDERVLPEMGVKVSFQESTRPIDPAADARPRLTVPAAAVRKDDGRDVVFVVERDRVERRAVTVGERRDERVEIVSGVTGGERVVTEGPADLADGDEVRVAEGS